MNHRITIFRTKPQNLGLSFSQKLKSVFTYYVGHSHVKFIILNINSIPNGNDFNSSTLSLKICPEAHTNNAQYK